MGTNIDTTTREHRNKDDWSDVPAQSYLSEIRIGSGYPALHVDANLNGLNKHDIATTLPPWLWDQVDWDETKENDNKYGSRYGTLVVGPTCPEDAPYTTRSAVERAQRVVRARREDVTADREEAEAFLEDFEGFVDTIVTDLTCIFMGEDENVDDQHLWGELRRAEESLRALRVWMYENRRTRFDV